MIFMTGDTHAEFYRFSSKRFPEGKNLTKEDVMIIAGDFGGIWDKDYSREYERHWLNWLNEKPWTTLFIDGNHENFDRLSILPLEERFGGIVGKVNDSIFHLKRGQVYTIDNKTIFTFGGGYSLDKSRRIPFISWWEEELPNFMEYKAGFENLQKVNNKVDYIFSHTCPVSDFQVLQEKFGFDHKINEEENPLREYLEGIKNTVDYKKWFCGHFHVDLAVGNTYFLYESIFSLNK